jgi:hypothetical protein
VILSEYNSRQSGRVCHASCIVFLLGNAHVAIWPDRAIRLEILDEHARGYCVADSLTLRKAVAKNESSRLDGLICCLALRQYSEDGPNVVPSAFHIAPNAHSVPVKNAARRTTPA